jgi:hypothetical protein
MDIEKLFADARRDPTLFSQLDINSILDSLENTSNDYLENQSLESLQTAVRDACIREKFPKLVVKSFCEKLADYRFIDQIRDLHKGKHVRWVRLGSEPKLTNGGIVVDIKFLDNGTHVLTKNNMNHFVQYKFDDCLTFQKLSVGEQLILMAYDYLGD